MHCSACQDQPELNRGRPSQGAVGMCLCQQPVPAAFTRLSGHAPGGQSYTGLPGSAPGQPCGHLAMRLEVKVTPSCPDQPLASHTATWPCGWGSKLHRAARIGHWPATRPPDHAAGGHNYTGLPAPAPGQPHGHLAMPLGVKVIPGCPAQPLASHIATWPCGW